MLKSILLVGIGSFFGGALRFAVSMLMKSACGHTFPWGTLLVNLAGCFAAGDVTGRPYQYAKAVGEGNVAAHSVIEYLSKN